MERQGNIMKVVTHLYRKRIIPKETIHLENDSILHMEKNLIITKWDTLKPRSDIAKGISAYFIDHGFKISKVYDHNHEIVYWYCDIIETNYDSKSNSYIFTDLLVDILVYENGFVKVVDLAEVADALTNGTLTALRAAKALRISDQLLEIIYSGEFSKFQKIIQNTEQHLNSF